MTTTVAAKKDTRQWVLDLQRSLQQPGMSLINHPTINKIVAGELTRPQLRLFAEQTFWTISQGEKLFGLGLVNAPNREVRLKAWEVLVEEMMGHITKTDNHIELLWKFCEAVGVPQGERNNIRPMPASLVFAQYSEFLARCRPWYYSTVGIGLALEGQVPGTYTKLVPALHKRYGLTLEQTIFFSVHLKADKDHGDTASALLGKYVSSEDEMRELEIVAHHAAKMWCDIWSLPLQIT